MQAMVAEVLPAEQPVPSASRVAVLMPAYNPDPIINRAVESLVQSSYPCDIYIVDDGSRTPVSELVAGAPRTTVIRLEQNQGVAHARNVGLKAILAKPYDFVALLDADDVCHPDRIATQVDYLDRHPEIGAVGSWARCTEESSGRTLYIARTPGEPDKVKKLLFYNAALVNSTTMMRADVLRSVGLYSEHYPVAEDYELARRISQKFAIANIPTVLLDYRISLGGLSRTRRRRQLLDRFKIQLKYFQATEPSAWLGLAKTCLLFLLPVAVIGKMKEFKDRP